MSLDIFNPSVSVVPKSIEGKTMLWYGGNRLGKTAQACKAKKPYYLAFERGINGIPGIPFAPIQTWKDFKLLNKQLTNPATLNKAKELYQTIILDTVSTAAFMCEQYVVSNAGVNRINDMNNGFGGWKDYANEFWREINLLTSAGYTVIFIAHESTREFQAEDGTTYTKIYPDGDKRSIDPICNLVDIIAYLKPRGLDQNGEELKSTALLVNTPMYHAGSRFDYLPKFLEEFSMENLEKALKEAIEKQEAEKAGSTVDYTQYQNNYKKEEVPFNELVAKVGAYAQTMADSGRFEMYQGIVEEYLGQGAKVMGVKEKQRQAVEMIYESLKNLLEEK